MSPARRRFLRAAGAASFGFIGGCAGRSKPTPAPSPTPGGRGNEDGATDPPKPSQRVRTVGGGRVALTDAVARKAVAYESLMGSGGVLAPSEAQFVVCELRPESDAAPPIGAFSLVVGDASFAPADVEADRGGRTASLAGLGGQEYGAAGDAGWIAFTLPSPLRTVDAEIRCRHGGETAAWSLPTDALEGLNWPNSAFELRSFSAATSGETVELSLTAENVSEADGRFLAAVYWPTETADDDESRLLRGDVPAGERFERSTRVELRRRRLPPDGSSETAGETTVTATVEGAVSGETEVAFDPLNGP